MFRTLLWAAVAALFIHIPTTSLAADGKRQELRHMRLAPVIVTLRQQVEDNIACNPPADTNVLLYELGRFNERMNRSGADARTKKESLVQSGWPESCALITKVRDWKGDVSEVLTVILNPLGDFILVSDDDVVWDWWMWREKYDMEVVSRQYPLYGYVPVVN